MWTFSLLCSRVPHFWAVFCTSVHCSALLHSVLHFCTVFCTSAQCSALLHSVLHFCTVLGTSAQCLALPHSVGTSACTSALLLWHFCVGFGSVLHSCVDYQGSSPLMVLATCQ